MYYIYLFKDGILNFLNNHETETTMTSSKNEWKETKGKIKAKFGKLSDSDIEGLHGHMDQLPSKVQKAYKYEKAKAELECKNFTDSLK